MIDYTQYAFQAPPQVIDPIPTVADYLDDYTARDEAWYQSWAYPLEGGGYGSRPSSFERRAPFIPIPDPIEDPTPPVLRSIDPVTGESYGMGNTGQEDRPVGSLVRDVGGMSYGDLWGEAMATQDPGIAETWPARLAGLISPIPGLGLVMGQMAEEGANIQNRLAMNEIGRRLGSLYPEQAVYNVSDRPDVVTMPGGTQVFTAPDLFPGEYTPEPESRGGGDIGGTGRDDPQSPSNRSGGGGMWA